MDFKSKDFDLPENIFYFHNIDLDSLTFVLDYDSKDKFYFNLLNRYYADVVDEPNAHSMVLAKPNESKYYHPQIPAFNIKYIEDCFTLKDYPDPNLYLIKNSCPAKYTTNDIFDCWYHKKKSWSDLKSIKKIDIVGMDKKQWISCIESDFKKRISPRSDTGENVILNPKSACISQKKNTTMTKRTRMPYSLREDMDIVKFIVKHKYAFNITGRDMWQKMEQANICKIRTWQSMKERYLKHIKWDLHSMSSKFQFLSREDLKLLRQGLNIEPIQSYEKAIQKSKCQEARINELYSGESS